MNLTQKEISIVIVGAAVVALGTGTNAQASNLIQNGSFEIGVDPEPTYLRLNAGSTAIDGWTLARSNTARPGFDAIDYVGGAWQASDGNRSIDLDASFEGGIGRISQTFSTVVDQSYLVTFDLAGNWFERAGIPVIKQMGVQAAGQSAHFSFDVTGKSASNMGWETVPWQFAAVDTETTLEFFSLSTLGTQGFGAALDSVSVFAVSDPAAVPEPGSLLGLVAFGAFGASYVLKRKQWAGCTWVRDLLHYSNELSQKN